MRLFLLASELLILAGRVLTVAEYSDVDGERPRWLSHNLDCDTVINTQRSSIIIDKFHSSSKLYIHLDVQVEVSLSVVSSCY